MASTLEKNNLMPEVQQKIKKKLNFEFEEIKTGRKVTSLKFYIHADKSIKPNIKGVDEVCATMEAKLQLKKKIALQNL